jgi:cyanophycinase
MTGTLALVGGAEWTEGCEFDAELLERSGGTEVLVVPTASAYENPAHVVARAKEWFGRMSAGVTELEVYTRTDALDPSAALPVRDAAFIYVSGGSPMHLRSVLKGTPVWEAIVSAYRHGAVLAGSAEGATVLCAHMVDTRGGAFTVGLDLIGDLTVVPRYDHWSEDKWHRTVRLAAAGVAVVGIEERTALIGDAAGWRVAGAGGVAVQRDGHRMEVADLAPPAR